MPLTTNLLVPLFKLIMVKCLSLSLVSKHGITFIKISDLLTKNVQLVQNTLHTYTVSTRKFDLNERREIVVCVWQFCGSWITGCDYGGSSPGNRMLLAFCFWWRSSVLFGQWSWSRTATTESSIFTPKCPTMEFSHIIFAEIPPLYLHTFSCYYLKVSSQSRKSEFNIFSIIHLNGHNFSCIWPISRK